MLDIIFNYICIVFCFYYYMWWFFGCISIFYDVLMIWKLCSVNEISYHNIWFLFIIISWILYCIVFSNIKILLSKNSKISLQAIWLIYKLFLMKEAPYYFDIIFYYNLSVKLYLRIKGEKIEKNLNLKSSWSWYVNFKVHIMLIKTKILNKNYKRSTKTRSLNVHVNTKTNIVSW